MEYRKAIHPHYEQCGRHKKLTGYDGLLFDGDILIHDKEYSTYSQAETALNALVYDLLMDLAERGLSNELPPTVESVPEPLPYTLDEIRYALEQVEPDWIKVEGLRVMAPDAIGEIVTVYCEACHDDGSSCAACDPANTMPRSVSILDVVEDVLSDTAQVLDMALGRMRGAESVVNELRRVRARIGQVQARATVLG